MERAETFFHDRGRAVQHLNSLEWNFQCVRSDLGQDRFEALPERGRSHRHRRRSVRIERNFRTLTRSCGSALDKKTKAISVISPIDLLALMLGLSFPAKLLQATVKHDVISAAVALSFRTGIGMTHSGELVGHLLFRNEIATAEIRRIDPQVAGRNIEKPLAKETAFKPARTTIGAGRRLVGHENFRIDVDIGHMIWPGQKLRDVAGRGKAIRPHISADVDPGGAPQAEHGTVFLAGDFNIALHLSRMVDGGEMLAAVLNPSDGTIEA